MSTMIDLCCRFDISLVHDHGQWLSTNRAAANVTRRLGIPRVVSPRGMLSPWALRHRRALKKMAWLSYGRRHLLSAAVVHATAEMEREELLNLGVKGLVAVIPNGIDFDDAPLPAKAESPREALFLSRLHPKKGLPDLVQAWARVRPRGWRLLIAGPDEGGHRAEIERLIAANTLGDEIRFTGPVDGPAKRDLYGRASLFVLPSRSENFGVVVAEALAAGTPVITTKATPWSLLAEYGCGWWIHPNADALEAALRDAVAETAEVLSERGNRGKRMVAEQFRWDGIGRKMSDVYESLLVESNRRSVVSTD